MDALRYLSHSTPGNLVVECQLGTHRIVTWTFTRFPNGGFGATETLWPSGTMAPGINLGSEVWAIVRPWLLEVAP